MKYSTYTEAELAKNAGFIWPELLTLDRFALGNPKTKALCRIMRPLIGIHLNLFESRNRIDTLKYYNRIFTSQTMISGFVHATLNGKTPDIKGKLDFICDIYENIHHDVIFYQQINAQIFQKESHILPPGWSDLSPSKNYTKKIQTITKIDNARVSLRNWVINDFLVTSHSELTMHAWRDLRNKKSHASIIASAKKAIDVSSSTATDCTKEITRIYEILSATLGYVIYMNFSILFHHGRAAEMLLLKQNQKSKKLSTFNFDAILPPKVKPIPRLPNYSKLLSLVTEISDFITPLSETLMQQHPDHKDYQKSQSGALRYGLFLHLLRHNSSLLESQLNRIAKANFTENESPIWIRDTKIKVALIEQKSIEFGITGFHKFCNFDENTLLQANFRTLSSLIQFCFEESKHNPSINKSGATVVIPQIAVYFFARLYKAINNDSAEIIEGTS